MSTTLKWQPVESGGSFGLEMKRVVAEMTGASEVVLEYEHVSFFRGIARGAPVGSELRADAERILELIDQHGRIRLWRE